MNQLFSKSLKMQKKLFKSFKQEMNKDNMAKKQKLEPAKEVKEEELTPL